jgi:hypothetical protein
MTIQKSSEIKDMEVSPVPIVPIQSFDLLIQLIAFGALRALGHALCLGGIHTVVQHHGLEIEIGCSGSCSLLKFFCGKCGLNIET